MTITLYHNDMSVCAQKVRLTLAEKGLEYESRHLNLRAGDQKNPDYLKLNPNGYVPTLVHDDFVVCESTVICEYLDDAFPVPALKPVDARGRARMRGFTKFIDAAIFPATGVVSMSIAFHHQYSPDVHPRMEAARPGWLANFRNLQKGTENPAFPNAIRRLDKMLADMEAALAAHGRPWLTGDMFTLADIGNAPYVTRLDHLKFLPHMVLHRPLSAQWYERLKVRPGYQDALAKWFNAKYLPLMEEKGTEAWPRVRELLAA
jgi:glutathione S-transferase